MKVKGTLIAIGISLAGFLIVAKICSAKTIDTVTAKVIDLEQQQIIKKTTTDIRYLVVTDRGTFICESSILNGKFDNSDLFYRLKEDSTYTFTVCGFGKGFLFDYRNILEVH